MSYESDIDIDITSEEIERLAAEEAADNEMPVWEVFAEETRLASATVYFEAPTKEDAERYARDMAGEGSFFEAYDFDIEDHNLSVVGEATEQAEYAWDDYLDK